MSPASAQRSGPRLTVYLSGLAAGQIEVTDWRQDLSGTGTVLPPDHVEVVLGVPDCNVTVAGDLDTVTGVFAEAVRRLAEVNRARATGGRPC